MSTTREALEAIGAELDKLEEHAAATSGHLAQLREGLHATRNTLTAVSANVELVVVNQEKDGRVIRDIQRAIGSLSDLIRAQHSETAAARSQVEARVRALEAR